MEIKAARASRTDVEATREAMAMMKVRLECKDMCLDILKSDNEEMREKIEASEEAIQNGSLLLAPWASLDVLGS